VLSLIDQPDAAELCAEVFGGRLGFVPYLMPGFVLAKKAAEVFDKNRKVEGLILDKHGIFTFGADAREAYERMIAFVTLAENRLKKNRKAVFASAKLPQHIAPAIDIAPILRGACTLRDAGGEGGLKFPSDDDHYDPDIWDFAYFSLTMGMAFQTSDVSITGPQIRRFATLHGAAAFFYNLIVLAFTINVTAGG
jgi:hypothetical protein